jgi:hypothetical protein
MNTVPVFQRWKQGSRPRLSLVGSQCFMLAGFPFDPIQLLKHARGGYNHPMVHSRHDRKG